MTDTLHTIVLPAAPNVSRVLAGPAMDPATVRSLILDGSGLGHDISRVAVSVPDPMTVSDAAISTGRQVSVTVTGGAPDTVARMGLALKMANGDVENFVIEFSVRSLAVVASFSPLLTASQGGALIDSQYRHLVEG